jgi:DNA-binding GntR family transcriptional regulator
MGEILRGRLSPGDRIVETKLAEQFNVSQAPVREALRDLELLGFVITSPFKGTSVRQLAVDDLVQIYPIRAVLEGLAARTAATRITEGTLRRLDALIIGMRSAVLRRDTDAAVNADIQFHALIVDASGNLVLSEIWQRMRFATTIHLHVTAKSEDARQRLGEKHMPILEALRARDGALAEQAMREHIEEATQIIYRAEGEQQAQRAAQQLSEKVQARGTRRGRPPRRQVDTA